jgi:hypothetical protein
MAELHALIIGVSAYPYLPDGTTPKANGYGMEQLSASAVSAYRLAQWLDEAAARLAVPVGSRRLLLSPSPSELALMPPAGSYKAATLDNIRTEALAWRTDCRSAKDNIAVFCFCGHGVQRTRQDVVLLAEDFGDDAGNPLFKAVDVNNLFDGMAPTEEDPNVARTQFWFIDACQVLPTEFKNFERLPVTGVFEVGLAGYDDRNAPIYYGSVPGGFAYTVRNETTIFGDALLQCLRGRAGFKLNAGTWAVTVGSLMSALPTVVAELNMKHRGTQVAVSGGIVSDMNRWLASLDQTPGVRVQIRLTPPDRAALSVTRLADGAPMVVPNPLEPNPFEAMWSAGSYQATFDPAGDGFDDDQLLVMPPSHDLTRPVLS